MVPRVAVLLAAGRSERLQPLGGGGSKALLRLGGLPLIERAIRGLLNGGVERVVVIVGHDADRVTAAAIAVDPGRVAVIRAQGWERGNGASLVAAAPAVAGESLFVVQTADHLFSSGTLKTLIEMGRPAVLVDHVDRVGETGEEMKIRVTDEGAVAFGKELSEPWIDCGAFLLPPDIFPAQRKAAHSGDWSLSGAITVFASAHPLATVPILPDGWWHDVDTPKDWRDARIGLRRSLGKYGDGPVSRLLNRPLSSRLSMALSGFRLAPGLLSIIGFAVALLAALICGLGWGIPGGVLVQTASVLDGVDGETARLQLRDGPRGALIDGVLDRLGDAAIVGGLGIWALDSRATPIMVLALMCSALTVSMLSMSIKDRAMALRLPGAADPTILQALAGRDGRLLILAISACLSLPVAGLAIVTVTGAAGTLARMRHLLHPASQLHPGSGCPPVGFSPVNEVAATPEEVA